MVSLSLTSKHFNILLKVSFFGSASCFWLIFVKYKEQQILDKICKVTRQKQISYFDFVPFFDFQYEKIIFNCQPSHFSPCSAVPVVWLLSSPRTSFTAHTADWNELVSELELLEHMFNASSWVTPVPSHFGQFFAVNTGQKKIIKVRVI